MEKLTKKLQNYGKPKNYCVLYDKLNDLAYWERLKIFNQGQLTETWIQSVTNDESDAHLVSTLSTPNDK
jgi:hypothetical protein